MRTWLSRGRVLQVESVLGFKCRVKPAATGLVWESEVISRSGGIKAPGRVSQRQQKLQLGDGG